ncbi:MAG: aminotransferase class I/II-fold pyridoxal phosphate-dependent enzyme [Clostridia bacterium]|nr:aminotransferase class I/II-fold pyridoxal phosphate-dependent enzyme [Clostridia bacterium]
MRRPMDEMLRAAAGRRSGHMPGHKGRAPFDEPLFALDTTELPVTDDLYRPFAAIAEAQALWAEAAGAEASLFLTDGSTAGIHVLLGLKTHPGDRVLLPRDAHLSAVSACVLLGLEPVWIPLDQRADGSPVLREERVLEAVETQPEARTLLLVRPDYFGRCLPLERIAAACRERGLFLAVDEAHGAHFPWLGAGWSAAGLADGWVQSVHKTLPGLTGSAALCLRNAEDRPRALSLLRRVQTSSPSFLLLRSIDDARAWMQEQGSIRLQALVKAADGLRARLGEWGLADGRQGWDADGSLLDPTRLVIASPAGGFALAEALERSGYDIEMADEERAVIILTAMDGEADVEALARLLEGLPPLPPIALQRQQPLPLLQAVLPPREAALGLTEAVPLTEAAGRIAAVAAGLYPPGIPLATPGEIISREIAERLRSAGPARRFGTEGETIACVSR